MKLIRAGTFYLIGVFGIICVSVLPQFFSTTGISNPLGYFKDLGLFLLKFVEPDSWRYQTPRAHGEFSLLGTIWEPYIYSIQIFLGAILLGFFIAFLLAFSTSFFPRYVSRWLKVTLSFLESIPDLVIAILLQIFTISVYKASGLELFNVAGYGEERIYFAPIITLAILPMISLFKILVFRIEEEYLKDYVVFLKSKGIHKSRILFRHILKNVLPSTFHHSKVIIWGTLSSQVLIEYIFNIHGLTFYILESLTPITIAVSLILLFTPFFAFFQLINIWLYEDPIYSQNVVINKKHSFNIVQSVKGWLKRLSRISWTKLKPWKPFVFLFAVFIRHLKNYKFAVGILFFIIVITISVIYSITTNDQVDQVRIVYEEDGLTVKSAPPHPPGIPFLLGSDRAGFDLLDQLVIGAKYTLVFGLLIAFLRVIFGLLGGTVFAFTFKEKQQGWVEKLVDSMHFLPLTIIAYILLRPIMTVSRNMEAVYTLSERIIFEVIILTILVIPLTTVLIGNEIKRLLQKEFIMSAIVLGGSKFHIFWHHILPHIGPRLSILFGQQFIQVLLIFMHLGVFNLFFGGTIADLPPRSISNEWSGLIGSTKFAFSNGQYWLVLWALLAFVLSIIAMQLIIKGIEEVQQVKVGVVFKGFKNKRKAKVKEDSYDSKYEVTVESFQPINNDDLR